MNKPSFVLKLELHENDEGADHRKIWVFPIDENWNDAQKEEVFARFKRKIVKELAVPGYIVSPPAQKSKEETRE